MREDHSAAGRQAENCGEGAGASRPDGVGLRFPSLSAKNAERMRDPSLILEDRINDLARRRRLGSPAYAGSIAARTAAEKPSQVQERSARPQPGTKMGASAGGFVAVSGSALRICFQSLRNVFEAHERLAAIARTPELEEQCATGRRVVDTAVGDPVDAQSAGHGNDVGVVADQDHQPVAGLAERAGNGRAGGALLHGLRDAVEERSRRTTRASAGVRMP